MSTSDAHRAPQADESLARYLQRLRIELGLSQKQVATKAQLHVQSLGKIERGQTVRLQTKTCTGLAYALQIPVEYLEALNNGQPIEVPGAIQFCPRCWKPGTTPESMWMHQRAKFCFECGTALKSRCHSCNEPISSLRHRFCPLCGTPYKEGGS